jgi:hypothetical protein
MRDESHETGSRVNNVAVEAVDTTPPKVRIAVYEFRRTALFCPGKLFSDSKAGPDACA